MALTSVARGLLYPTNDLFSAQTSATIDAVTEKVAMIGRLYIDGRPTAAKTLSTGNIQYRTGACTFASGTTKVDIGIQGVASGAGPIAQPDGTFTVKTTLTGGGGGITTSAWNTATMTSGSASLSHGDLFAIVFDMTARGGADSVLVNTTNVTGNLARGAGFPVTNAFVSSAWQTTQTIGAGRLPNAIITFDDGTLGWFDFTIPTSTGTTDTFQDSTNPDERGMLFQIPWDVKIDALWLSGGVTDANSDFTLKLYSDPTGTPSLATSVAVLAEQQSVTGSDLFSCFVLASEISLSRNTDYAVTVLATGTSNTRLANITLGNTAHRAAIPGGTTLKKVTRNNSTGAFTAESPATTMYPIGVRISQINDFAGLSRARAASGF